MNDIEQKTFDKAIHSLRDANQQLLATKQELSDFRQEVSDAVMSYFQPYDSPVGFQRFIIPAPKPDPLEEIIGELDDGTWGETKAEYADRFRAALEARGLEIREK